MGLVAIGPWDLLLSWEAPGGVDAKLLKYYEITGSFVDSVPAKTVYNVIPKTKGVLPGSSYIVTMKVVYIDGSKSEAMSLETSTPIDRKSCAIPSNNLLTFREFVWRSL